MASSSSPARESNDVERLARLVNGVSFAMLTTQGANHELRSRPMTLQQGDFDGDFWFFTARNASVAEDIRAHPNVNLAFAEPKNQTYVSASGTAELNFDRAKMEELWSPVYQAWFPQGLDDPDLCLIRVHVESADYWESPHSRVVQMLGFAKMILTARGSEAEDVGTRGHVEFRTTATREKEDLFWE